MKIEQVALQLYTLRDYLKTPGDMRQTLRRVREIGYLAVEAAGLGPIAEEEFMAVLDREGLTLCSTHEPSRVILDEPEKLVERFGKLKCRLTAYPFPADVRFDSREAVIEFARRLNRAGQVLHGAGITLMYHNHQHEFRKVDGERVIDLIFHYTEPVLLQAELDTYWVQYGGGDILEYCRMLSGRLPVIHLKDYAIDADNRPVFCEVGKGNLRFREIVKAAEEAGCKWFVVEQDTCPGDPFDSIKQSLDYIAEYLCD